MKKNDWVLIAAVLFLAMAWLGIHFFQPQKDTGMVVVSINGEEYGFWPLSENCTVRIEDTNRLLIEDGQANMIWADCPDQLCVHQKAISREGESIICLPNKVVVSIVDGAERKVDAVTKLPCRQKSITMNKGGRFVIMHICSRFRQGCAIQEVFI